MRILRRTLLLMAVMLACGSWEARAASYSGNLNMQMDGTDGPAVAPTVIGGRIRYQFTKTNYDGAASTWMKVEWNGWADQVGGNTSGGAANMGPTDDVRFDNRLRMKVGGVGGDPANIDLTSMETTKTYVFNLWDTGSTLDPDQANSFAAIAVNEINHKNALVSFGTPGTSRSGNDIIMNSASTAENGGSNEELWFQWTDDNFATKSFIGQSSIAANQTATITLTEGGLEEGETLRWLVMNSADSDSGTIAASTGGILNWDLATINRTSQEIYSVTDDDTTAPSLTAFSVSDQTDAQVAAGGYTISGSIQDTGSGVNNNGATVSGNDFSPNFDLLNNANTVIANDQVFTTRPADGTAQGSPGTLSASAPAVGANIDLGTYKVRVSATDNDEDPTLAANDRTAVVDSQVATFTVTDDDSAGPVINGLDFPATVDVSDSCIVTAQINDVTGTTDGATVTLYYGYGVPATPLAPSSGSGDGEYKFTIPPQTGQGGNTLLFYIVASDNDSDRTGDAAQTTENNGGGYYEIDITVAVLTTDNAVWNGDDDVDDFWRSQTNWVGVARPDVGGKAILNFAGAVRTANINDYTAGQQFNALFFNSGADPFNLSGNSFAISNKIENNSVSAQTIENDLELNGPVSTEVNPVAGDLTLTGAVTVDGANLLIYSDDSGSASTVRFEGAVSQGAGSSKLIVRQNATVEIAAANTLTGDIEIDRGAIHIENGGSVAGGTAYVGNGTLPAMAAEVVITDTDGGTTVSRTMQINPGNGSNRTLGGANTSGINTFSGLIDRDTDVDNEGLTLTAAAGGIVDYTGNIPGEDPITITGGGVTRFSAPVKANTGTITITGNSTLRMNLDNMLVDSVDMTVNGGSTFDLNNFSDEMGWLEGAGNVTLGSAQLRVNHSSNREFSGIISGTGSVAKKGTGIWTLSGANTWSGSVFPVGGTLQFNASPGVGFTGTIQLGETFGGDAATLATGIGGVTISNPITVRSGSTGQKTIRANNTTGTGTFSGAVTMNADLTIVATAGGSLALGAGGITQGANSIYVQNYTDVTIGAVTGSGAIEKMDDHGGTLILTGDVNTGDIRHNDGNIRVAAGGDISGSGIYYLGSDIVAFQNNTTLELGANGIDIGRTIEVENATGAEVKTIRSTVAGTQTLSGTVRLDSKDLILSSTNGSTLVVSGTLDFDYDGDNDVYTRGPGDLTFSGQLNSGSGACDLFTQGTGTVTLSGNNSGQSFQIEHGGGTLYITGANALGTSYADKLKINFGGTTTRVGVTITPASFGIRYTGNHTHTIAVDNGVTFTVPGAIDDDTFGVTGNLVKSGAGDLTVQAVNTLSGTLTVSAGTLHVSGGSSFSTASTTVSAGGYLKGNGTVGSLSVSGTVAAGASVGTLNAGATTFAPSATNAWEINDFGGSYGSDPGWDRLAISGALNITATSAQPVTIEIRSLSGSSPGNAANFDNTLPYTRSIATASGGISGFAVNKFTINTSNFANPMAGGSWAIQQTGNDLELVYTPSSGLPDQTVFQFK